ncbi:MAG: hypothetical protein L6Q26_12410 [Anaerolineales bacterium]|nr:hypothetical protein [Anaerolineales bacterium]NUQ84556.1 hypothetical protein [Anaerolineales bacterium]
MFRLRRLTLFIVLLASACSQKPSVDSISEPSSPAPAISITLTPLSTFTPHPTFSLANTALPATPVSQPTLGKTPQVPFGLTFDQINPIFYGKIFLGATSGDIWLYPREVYPLLGNAQVYDFYDQNFQPFPTTVVVPEPRTEGAHQCDFLDFKFVDPGIGDVSPVLGVKPGQSVTFRPVQTIAQDSGLYEQYLQEWLVLQGVSSPELGVVKVLRVDLEGDAVDEVILVATNIEDSMGGLHEAGAGKYSVVLMRKVIGAQVYTVPLVVEIYYATDSKMEYPIIYDVDHIYDLNGDGNLEIILSGRWWEGGGLFVHEVHELNAVRVLDLICGWDPR